MIIDGLKELLDIQKNSLMSDIVNAVKIGDFVLSSGKKSNFYINCKKVILQPNTMEAIGKYILYISWNIDYSSVAGITSGADPIVCSCVAFNKDNGLFIRKKQKNHGTKELIEGKFKEGDKVLIVDDVLTTGESIKYSYDVLIEHKLQPQAIIVLVDRQENDAVNDLEKYTSIPVISIITKEEIFKYKEDNE